MVGSGFGGQVCSSPAGDEQKVARRVGGRAVRLPSTHLQGKDFPSIRGQQLTHSSFLDN